jgi:hypothetical protein
VVVIIIVVRILHKRLKVRKHHKKGDAESGHHLTGKAVLAGLFI